MLVRMRRAAQRKRTVHQPVLAGRPHVGASYCAHREVALVDALTCAGDLLQELATQWQACDDADASGTTVTLILHNRETQKLTSINIGDTHAYILRGGKGASR